VDKGISVREAEEMAGAQTRGKKGARTEGRSALDVNRRAGPDIRALEEKLIEKLGTKVEVRGSSSKGKIQISYFSADDLERILQILK
jgi:ParB family chromosome partitioning protein